MQYGKKNSIQVVLTAVFISVSGTTLAQSGEVNESITQQPTIQAPVPIPGVKPNLNLPARSIQRTGTAISGARNSISIKSTDAGIVHRPAAPSAPLSPLPQSGSNCINCGIIDFINSAQGNAINAMASGIIAGTIARRIGEHDTHPHTDHTPGRHAHQVQQHYHVGVTMQDGSRQIISVPDVSHLHHGDNVQLIDGMIIPEQQANQ
ncbi:hypothetical protein SAMN05421690_10123 [Nitrosomonas sp. Nm51]|uniref:hypothetical protein n=1 Tax=Nitrosomonas sp. Nm51 TaxID=133720 RepID=UPI0008C7536E|nr:hypothetical protein [Nitrosomonas sp. Nm51]SER19509.1 hypothetical protein SAMN05421690_10123 [Nitrosomonas sp. Nm51]